MSTTVNELLQVMLVRIDMQNRGITHPPLVVCVATQRLVEKLSKLAAYEIIDIKLHERSAYVQYIRVKTGEILAEIGESEVQQSTFGA